MCIILLAGLSGSGKSTLAKLITDKLKAYYSSGDTFMEEEWLKLAPKIFTEGWLTPEGKPLLRAAARDYNRGKIFFDRTRSAMNQHFANEILKAHSQNHQFFVADWFFMPALKIWQTADIKIITVAEREMRHTYLAKRKPVGISRESSPGFDRQAEFLYTQEVLNEALVFENCFNGIDEFEDFATEMVNNILLKTSIE